jgi:uncharacterized phage protein gp47/JayE
MSEITGLGFNRTRLDEILADLQSKMVNIFGADINVEPDSIDGQTLGIFAEAYDNLTQLTEQAYQNINPQTALGVALSRIVQLNGIRRIEGIKTTVTLTITGTPGTSIPINSNVRNPVTNEVFTTLSTVIIGSLGIVTVLAESVVVGVITAPPGTITKIDNPVFGWSSVTNSSPVILGRLEETDEELRIRRRKSTVTPAQSLVDAIYGSLINIPQVVQAIVLENPTGVPDVNGQNPHSVHVIVLGGSNAEIAKVIWEKKSLGVELIGSETVIVNDSLSNPHSIKFSRPVEVPIYITVNVVSKPGWPTDGANRIKEELVNWVLSNQSIGEEVIQSRLYDPVNNVPGHSITTLFIGVAPTPTSESNLTINYLDLAVADSSRIIVNVAT